MMANLGRFNSVLTDYETAIRLGGKKRRSWQQDMKGLFWYIHNYATNAYEEQQGDDVRAIKCHPACDNASSKRAGVAGSIYARAHINKIPFEQIKKSQQNLADKQNPL